MIHHVRIKRPLESEVKTSMKKKTLSTNRFTVLLAPVKTHGLRVQFSNQHKCLLIRYTCWVCGCLVVSGFKTKGA